MSSKIASITWQTWVLLTFYAVLGVCAVNALDATDESASTLFFAAAFPVLPLVALHAGALAARFMRLRSLRPDVDPVILLEETMRIVTRRGALVLAAGTGALIWSFEEEWAELTVFAIAALGAFGVVVTIGLWTTAFGKLTDAVMRTKRKFVPNIAIADDDIHDVFELKGIQLPMAFILKVEGAMPVGLDGETRIVVDSVGKTGEVSACSRVLHARRGILRAPTAGVWLQDAFGLTSFSVASTDQATVKVLPRASKIDHVPPSWLRVNDDRDDARPTKRPTEDFLQLKPYAQGDAWNRVHWPSSLRRGEVMVRVAEGRPETHRKVRVVLDTQIRPELMQYADALAPALDLAVDAWIAIANQLKEAGHDVEVVAALSGGLDDNEGGAHIESARCRRLPERSLLDMGARAAFQTEIATPALVDGDENAIIVTARLAPVSHMIEGCRFVVVDPRTVLPSLPTQQKTWWHALFVLPFEPGDDRNGWFTRQRVKAQSYVQLSQQAMLADLLAYQSVANCSQDGAHVVRKGQHLSLADLPKITTPLRKPRQQARQRRVA